MSYFERFPYIKYQFPDNVIRSYKNISIRPAILERVKEFQDNLTPYYIKEGELPDHIAYDKYGKSTLHWIIMLSNDIMNLHTDWPKSDTQFKKYLTQKYKTQETNKENTITLTELEIQRFVEFSGTPENKFTSYIIIDSERNGITVDSEGALGDSDEYVILRPKYLQFTQKDPIYKNVEFNDTYIQVEEWLTRKDAFGYSNTYIGEVIPISFYQYEFEENEEKRKIRIPRQEVVDKIVDEFPELVRQ